jgi:hypothetical protein
MNEDSPNGSPYVELTKHDQFKTKHDTFGVLLSVSITRIIVFGFMTHSMVWEEL